MNASPAEPEYVTPRTQYRNPIAHLFCSSKVTMKNGKSMDLKMKIFETFEDPSFTIFAKVYSLGMMGLIILATACYVLESEAVLIGGGLPASALPIFADIELVSVVIFSLEYIIRICCCPCEPCPWGVVRFIMAPQNIVDALACIPFWVTFFMKLADPDMESNGLGFVRVIRLVRIFRVFKLGKYSSGIQMFTGAISRSMQSLSILLLLMLLGVVICSSIMHIAESDVANVNKTGYDAELLAMSGVDAATQMYCFGTIPRCFWWAFVTMTTVGYGDCYPVTNGGKILAMATMMLGVLIIAMPITVVGSNFQKMVEMYEEDTGGLREFDLNEDDTIDEMELRHFLHAKRKDQAIKAGSDTNPARLMAKYDPQGNGTLTADEFALLKRDIIDPNATDPQLTIRTLVKRQTAVESKVRSIQEQLGRIEALLHKQAGLPPPEVPVLTTADSYEEADDGNGPAKEVS